MTKKKSLKKVRKRKKTVSKKTERQALKHTGGEYDLMLAFASALTGLNFRQLLHGDDVEAKKKMEQFVSPHGHRVSVVRAAGNAPDTKCI